MVTALFLFFIALLLMFAAVMTILRARRLEQIEKVHARLSALAFATPAQELEPTVGGGPMDALGRWLNRVGLQLTPLTALLIMGAAALGGWGIRHHFGWAGAWVWWTLAATVCVFLPQVRYAQKVNKLVSQIPLFIDQTIRGLVTGRNVEGAIQLAVADTQEPLRELMARVDRSVSLGADLGDALREAASFYDIKEMHMLALAIHTSRVYGGSPRDMLESIVSLIRQREQMRRELLAMTGETRVTAWVLGGIPVLIAGWMFWANPNMFDAMLNDEAGRNAMAIAVGMQVAGALILWRMIKSI